MNVLFVGFDSISFWCYLGIMNVITIMKKLAQKGDLVVIPRREYEVFSQWKQRVMVRLEENWFWTPEWQKKEAEADGAIRKGKISQQFSDYKKLLFALRRKKKS